MHFALSSLKSVSNVALMVPVLSLLLFFAAAAPLPACGAEAAKKTEVPENSQVKKPALQTPTTESASADSLAEIEVGPFELVRKYRSMEGPYVIKKFRVADLLASGRIRLPASSVIYLDKDGPPISMSGNNAVRSGLADPAESVIGLKTMPDAERELLWFHGLKLQVLDENDKPLPTAEFICHMNLDVDQVTRFSAFPDLERSGNARLFTLTQGQTEFHFPDGFAVPVASDEEWKFTFQAANRTTDEQRRIKHLCTLYFSKDSRTKPSPKALHWYNPYIAVQVDVATKAPEHHGPSCLALTPGDNAPNMVPDSPFKDDKGRTLSGHWLVKPGRHSYSIPVAEIESGMAQTDNKIHAVWSHVHPACTSTALYECSQGQRKKVFEVKVKTSFANGPELRKIENIVSSRGILLPANKEYELLARYDNPLKDALDSMVALGVFCESKTYKKPDWSVISPSFSNAETSKKKPDAINKNLQDDSKCNDIYCGIKPARNNPD